MIVLPLYILAINRKCNFLKILFSEARRLEYLPIKLKKKKMCDFYEGKYKTSLKNIKGPSK